MSETREDLVFFSVTEEHKVLLRELAESLFETEAGAFKACVALAIEKGLDPKPFKNGKTTWNATTMSDLVDFLTWYQGTSSPIRLANELGFAGLNYYSESKNSGTDPKDLFFKASVKDS
jgi:hypothetical protein